MSSLEFIKNNYKPYKISKYKSTTIVDSLSGKFLIKSEKKDLFSLFSYLYNRGFSAYPELIKKIDKDNIFKYEESNNIPLNQKVIEMADIIASLHNKTIYFKTTTIDTYKEIKENIENNISYLENYYYSLFQNILKEEYQSPSRYLFARNYNLYLNAINYVKENLNFWYDKVENLDKIRVCVVHNNLELDHFIYSDHNILISWDDYLLDTPVLDLYNFFKKDYSQFDFSIFLKRYLRSFELLEEEKLLFNILINIPLNFELGEDEFENTLNVRNSILYIKNAQALVRPDNLEHEKEQKT